MLTGTKQFTLVQREDDATDEKGWVVEELCDIFDLPSVANDGYLIAHDIIEHVNGIDEIGGIGEELQAMGGVWNTRGQHCDIRRGPYANRISPQENLSNDFLDMARRFISGEEMGCETPELVESGYEDDFNEIWQYARENLHHEIDPEDFDEDKIEEFRKSAEAFFHLGLVKHEKMYGDGLMANSLFYGIVYALEGKVDKEAEFYENICITIDYDNWEVTAEMVEDFEYEDEYEYE
jgi:hypothetical protein